jgi:hypothetical protein
MVAVTHFVAVAVLEDILVLEVTARHLRVPQHRAALALAAAAAVAEIQAA